MSQSGKVSRVCPRRLTATVAAAVLTLGSHSRRGVVANGIGRRRRVRRHVLGDGAMSNDPAGSVVGGGEVEADR
jgi:hypothetical protein